MCVSLPVCQTQLPSAKTRPNFLEVTLLPFVEPKFRLIFNFPKSLLSYTKNITKSKFCKRQFTCQDVTLCLFMFVWMCVCIQAIPYVLQSPYSFYIGNKWISIYLSINMIHWNIKIAHRLPRMKVTSKDTIGTCFSN